MKNTTKFKLIMLLIGNLALTGLLSGCGKTDDYSELVEMLNRGEMISIEVKEPSFAKEEQGTESQLLWEELASITTNDVLRKEWDNILGIINTDAGKNGVLYVDASGVNINNNTLRMALHNRAFVQFLEKEASLETLAEAVQRQYADLEVGVDETSTMKAVYMGINGYFNLLPDSTPNYCNPDSTLNRLEFMSMVMRAETPVQEIKADNTFATAVGSNDLNIYAQEVSDSSYLDLASKSLNNQTANGTITRAEAVYLLMQRYFADELATVDVSNIKLDDCKDGGNIAEQQKFIENGVEKTYWKSYTMTYTIMNPDDGISTDLYRAICLASQKGIISTETRFDEGITKSEAVEMLVKTLQSEPSVTVFNATMGTTSGYDVSDTDTKVEEDVSINSTSDNIVLGDDEYKGDDPADTGKAPEPTPEATTEPATEEMKEHATSTVDKASQVKDPNADSGLTVGPDGFATDGVGVDLDKDGVISNFEAEFWQNFMGDTPSTPSTSSGSGNNSTTIPSGGSTVPGPTGQAGGMPTHEDQTDESNWIVPGSGDATGAENYTVQ